MMYKTIDEAYTKATPHLISIAKTFLYNTDYAIDCVHEAFAKALDYVRRHPRAHISDFILVRETMAAIRRDNKHYSIEIGRLDDNNRTDAVEGNNSNECD